MAALVEPNRGLIELYFRAEVLNRSIELLQSRGAHTVRIDAGDWTPDSALPELGRALDFPDHFGANLDALADCLFDVISGEYGFAQNASTRILAIYQFDSFMGSDPSGAQKLLDVLYDTCVIALKLGQPFLVMLQSDTADLALPPVGAQTIAWNQAEFAKTSRR